MIIIEPREVADPRSATERKTSLRAVTITEAFRIAILVLWSSKLGSFLDVYSVLFRCSAIVAFVMEKRQESTCWLNTAKSFELSQPPEFQIVLFYGFG